MDVGLFSVRGSIESSATSSSSGSSSELTVTIAGRYVQPRCQLTIGGDLLPSRNLQDAVHQALRLASESERKTELIKVFDRYGHVYPTSVELGGMKHIWSTRKKKDQVCHTRAVKGVVLMRFPGQRRAI